ncbi:MAG: MFS transporter [Burkholderiaceae bacterium]|jgi:DHA2 family multidrug resistance protein-like MFS transporter
MSHPDLALSQPREGLTSSERRALVAVLLGVALATLDTAIANTALPTIAADLHSPAAASVWIINAYQLTMVASLLPFAALGDLLGPRRVYLGGLAVFTAASLACALSPTLAFLTGARALQGVGGGAMMSVNVALIRLIYPPARLGRGVGMNALVVGIGFAVGPTIASLVLAAASWPWLFGLNVPLGLLALAVAYSALPQNAHHGRAFDPVTALLTAVCFSALIFTLTSVAQWQSRAQILSSLALACASGTALLIRERGHASPMLPVDLLRRPMFALSTITAIAAFAAQGLAFVSLPFYFEEVLHRNPINTGFLMTAWPVVVAAAAPFAGRLSDKYAPGLLGGIGLAILCLGEAALALLPAAPSAGRIVVYLAICGAGFGMFQAPNLRALMSSAPPERSGGASGVIAIARLIGQTTGAALVAMCFHYAGVEGSALALALGSLSAGLASLASFARIWAY